MPRDDIETGVPESDVDNDEKCPVKKLRRALIEATHFTIWPVS